MIRLAVESDKRYVIWDNKSVCVDDDQNEVYEAFESTEPVTQFASTRGAKVLVKDDTDLMSASLTSNRISAVMTFRAIIACETSWKVTQCLKAQVDAVHFIPEKGVFGFYASNYEVQHTKRGRDGSQLELDRNGAKKFQASTLRVHGFGWQVELGKSEPLKVKTMAFDLSQSITADPVVCYLIESFVVSDFEAGAMSDVQTNMYVIMANMLHYSRWFYAYVLRKTDHNDISINVQWGDSTSDRRINNMKSLLKLFSERLAACQPDDLQHEDDVAANEERKSRIAKLNDWLERNHIGNGT